MTNRKDEYGKLLKDKFRLTKFGNWLRETSIDEIPTLINILRGEMSFIGPRPLLVEYLTLYSDYERKRHNIKPGLTGLAQIKGRNSISWRTKFKYDIFYIENLSFNFGYKNFFYDYFQSNKKRGY